MKKYLNMIIDFPKWVNEKLPMNCWNSCMDDSEGNLAKWAGEVFRVGAFVTLAYSLCATVSILWTGGMGEGAQEMVGSLLGMLLFAYAASKSMLTLSEQYSYSDSYSYLCVDA